MELALVIPYPVVAGMAAMQITTAIVCPFRLYPYLLLGVTPPDWVTTLLFSIAVCCNVLRCLGIRQSVAFVLVLAGLAFFHLHTAAIVATGYFILVHTPIHYWICMKRGQRTSISIAFLLTIAAAFIMRVMKPRGNIVLTYQLQKLVVAHTITEWRIHDYFEELSEEREERSRRHKKRRDQYRKTYGEWMPSWPIQTPTEALHEE